jgi:hypothetical protein
MTQVPDPGRPARARRRRLLEARAYREQVLWALVAAIVAGLCKAYPLPTLPAGVDTPTQLPAAVCVAYGARQPSANCTT